MTGQSFCINRLGGRILSVAVGLFVLQIALWLKCVHQWSGSTVYLREKDMWIPAYTHMCESVPAIVVPAAIAAFAGLVVATFGEVIGVFRVTRQQRGEGQAMESMSQPLSKEREREIVPKYGLPNIGAERFPLVSTFAMFLRVLGFLLVAAGVILFLREFIPWLTCNPAKLPPQQSFGIPVQGACTVPYVQLALTGAVFVIGLGIVAVGELLGLFRSIEGNTFKLLEVTREADYKGKLAQGS